MKFNKRFLMCLAIVGILLVPSVAKADVDGAVALNKWLRNVPTDDVLNVADLTRTTNKVSRHQTVYWVVHQSDTVISTAKTVQDGELIDCEIGHATTGCSSAPLFIQSEGAMLCVDGQMEDNTVGQMGAKYHICSSSSCLRTVSSLPVKAIDLGEAGFCAELGPVGITVVPGSDGPDIGGSWIYINVSADYSFAASGDTALFWVTGH